MWHVPNPVARIIERRASLTVIALVIATALMAPFDLGWRQIQILAYVGLAGFLVEFWWDSHRTSDELADIRAERDEALRGANQADALAERAGELEAELYGLQMERDELRRERKSPRLTMEEVLASLDAHLGYTSLVTKHREMRDAGLGEQWPVTSIQLRDESTILISAHVDEHAEHLASEWISLVDPAATTLLAAQVASSADHQLTVLTDIGYFPEYLQSQLTEEQVLPPAGYTVRLLGLTLPVYVALSDTQVADFGHALRQASRVISSAINPPQRPAILEEGELEDA